MTSVPRNVPRLIILSVIAALFVAVFGSLGVWQVQRLYEKRALIAAVDARAEAPAVPAPGPDEWGAITRAKDAYRHVEVKGRFLNYQEVQIYYSTKLGPGYFVMTPLLRPDGTYVMINRGFVPEEKRDPSTRQAPRGEVTVTGLLRMSEDKRWLFARKNDPASNKWYRRDIGSIAQAKGLSPIAPYFIDAEFTPTPGGVPIGGMTVVKFRNAHLSYALTWFGLAIGTLVLYAIVLHFEGMWGRYTRGQEDDD